MDNGNFWLFLLPQDIDSVLATEVELVSLPAFEKGFFVCVSDTQLTEFEIELK